MLRITPKTGFKIRDPEHALRAPLPADGILVSKINPFWRRRLRDGDITISEDRPAPRPPVDTRAPETAPPSTPTRATKV